MKALNVLLALLVSALMALAVFELGLRLVPAFRPQPTLNRFDPHTGWSKVPGRTVVRKVVGEDVEFAINAAGLREDPQVGPDKAAGTFRVLLLGDSFTLGYTVARADGFADLLEARWRAEGRGVDVINAGTEGWSTDQEAAWFLHDGQAYAPDLVLLFPYENDIYWCGQASYQRYPKPRFEPSGRMELRELADPGPAPLLERSALYTFFGQVLAPLTQRHPTRAEFEVPGTSICIAREFAPLLNQAPDFLGDCERRMRGALIALKTGCAQVGAELVVVPIPSKSVLDRDEREFFRTWSHGLGGLDDAQWSPDRPVETFLAAARGLELRTIDPRAGLAQSAAQGKLYFEHAAEWHFNVAGNRAFANLLHTELDALGVFPEGHRAKQAVAAEDVLAPRPARPARWPYVFGALWVLLSALFMGTYADERNWKAPLKILGMLAAIFAIVLGGGALVRLLPAAWAPWFLGVFVLAVLGFVVWKLGRRVGTILELFRSFVERGHWYLMPLIVVLLTIGSLLVVAASSPLIAPFIYTLF